MFVFVDGVLFKNGVEAPLHRINQHNEHAYNRCRVPINNEMTTPQRFQDATTPTGDSAGFIIGNLLEIDIFSKYYSTFTVMKCVDQNSTRLEATFGRTRLE